MVRDNEAQHFELLPQRDTVIRQNKILMVLGRELDPARFSSIGSYYDAKNVRRRVAALTVIPSAARNLATTEGGS
ncbi:MAG: hypothetical protein IH986_02870 [Planctomycetes bacterium]|nr:hypothetical protein [Planctomycetota bacterium]